MKSKYYAAVLATVLTGAVTYSAALAQHANFRKSPTVKEEILIDNDDVKVTRVTIPKGATQVPDAPRMKRVIVWITKTESERHDTRPEDKGEKVKREAGNAIFRTASKHVITNTGDDKQVSVIVELKH